MRREKKKNHWNSLCSEWKACYQDIQGRAGRQIKVFWAVGKNKTIQSAHKEGKIEKANVTETLSKRNES